MNDELRIIIRNNHDCDGITECIINEFRSHFNRVSGVVLDCNSDERKRDDEFEYISAESFCTHDNSIIRAAHRAIDGDTLEAMLPYKSMAMHIMMRTIHYDVFDRKYLEDVYYRHLKYWNELLIDKDINYVLFMCIPHHVGEYILYALCEVRGIKTTVLYPQLLNEGTAFFLGSGIEQIGENINEYYNSISDKKISLDDLSDFMKGLIANTLSNRVMGAPSREKITANSKQLMYSEIKKSRIIKNRIKVIAGCLGLYKKKSKSEIVIQNSYLSKARKYEKRMDHLKDYCKLAVLPKDGEKYIYFPLQMTPEASTMPLAGEFKNQLLSIELLAEMAKEFDLLVYVKEHWVQYNREPGFYGRVAAIDNVRLISWDCNSIDLIDRAVAVASQTGNCLFEALLKKKCSISIGAGCTFKGAPNLFQVLNREHLRNALESALANEKKICDEDVYKYLYAIEQSFVFLYLDSLDEAVPNYSKEDSARKIVTFSAQNIMRKVNSAMEMGG